MEALAFFQHPQAFQGRNWGLRLDLGLCARKLPARAGKLICILWNTYALSHGNNPSLWDSAQARKTAVIPSLRTASPCKPQESQEKCTLLPQRVLVQRPPNIISIRATKRFGYTTSQRASLASSVTARLPTNITRISCSNQHPPPHLETGIENQLPSCMPANAYPVTSLRQSSAAKKFKKT